MRALLDKLYNHHTLSHEESKEILMKIASEDIPEAQLASFLTIFKLRGITVEELKGFRSALLDLCISIDLSAFDAIDLCGTGGDGKNTFNISTLSSFVVAGADIKVSKHGNYGVSSVSGSSNVLQHFGYQFTNDEANLQRQIDQANICFLHAPLFHPAMKAVGPVRRSLGVKTFFNMLGPLVNPSRPKKQLVGVFNLELARLYQYINQDLAHDLYIVHSLDGYDEVSLTGDFKLINKENELLAGPEYFGFTTLNPHDLYGGDSVAEAAAIFMKILDNEGTEAQRSVVVVNAALAIQCSLQNISIEEAVQKANESLVSGKARHAFKKLLSL